MTRAALAAALVAILLGAAPAAAAPTLVPVGSFDSPVYVAAPPRDESRLFVVELGGTVREVRDGVVQPDPFIDVRDIVATGGERGLLSMAFPPDYAESGLTYVYLTVAEPLGELRILEVDASGGRRVGLAPVPPRRGQPQRRADRVRARRAALAGAG